MFLIDIIFEAIEFKYQLASNIDYQLIIISTYSVHLIRKY